MLKLICKFSNNLIVFNNILLPKIIQNIAIELLNFDTQRKININLTELINQKTIVREISDENRIEINLNFKYTSFFIIFFNYIFLVFF